MLAASSKHVAPSRGHPTARQSITCGFGRIRKEIGGAWASQVELVGVRGFEPPPPCFPVFGGGAPCNRINALPFRATPENTYSVVEATASGGYPGVTAAACAALSA